MHYSISCPQTIQCFNMNEICFEKICQEKTSLSLIAELLQCLKNVEVGDEWQCFCRYHSWIQNRGWDFAETCATEAASKAATCYRLEPTQRPRKVLFRATCKVNLQDIHLTRTKAWTHEGCRLKLRISHWKIFRFLISRKQKHKRRKAAG